MADQQQLEEASSSVPDFPNEQGQVTVLHDLVAGGVAGSASVIVGHPFDTIKVRLQTSTSSGGNGNAGILTTVSQFGGISSLFRGMMAPLITASAVNAIIFSSYGASSRLWDSMMTGSNINEGIQQQQQQQKISLGEVSNSVIMINQKQPQRDLPQEIDLVVEQVQKENEAVHDPFFKAFICGSITGAAQALLICPMEHIKCRLQVQDGRKGAINTYKGPFDAIKQIFQSHGIKGLYRGWWSTCWREIPAFGLYFSTYDYVKDKCNTYFVEQAIKHDTKEHDGEDDDYDVAYPHHHHTWIASTLAGGISGSLTWAIVYPIDVIKSKVQTLSFSTPVNELRMINICRNIIKNHGWKHLFRGLGVTLLRAFPVNGIIFPVYEFTLQTISGGGFNSNALPNPEQYNKKEHF